MVWLAVIVSAFLFYKFVERRHKFIFLKFAGVLAVAGGIIVGAILLHSEWQDRKRRDGIKVDFLGNELKGDEIKAIFVEEALRTLLQEIKSYYPGIEEKDFPKVKQKLFPWWVPFSEGKSDYDLGLTYDEFLISDDAKSDDPDKAKLAKKELEKIETERLTRYLAKLPKLRELNRTGLARMLFANFISKATGTFNDPKNKSNFEQALLQEEKNSRARHEELLRRATDQLYELINAAAKVDVIASFSVCNKRNVPLNSYSFYASGFQRDRSTAQALRKSGDYGSSSRFEGDIIIAPKSCQTIVWTGDYKFFDRHEVSLVLGNWKDK